jgi:VanZ family protein
MNEDMASNRKWRGRFIRYAPFLFWLLVVLGFSSDQASSDQTSRFIRPLLDFLFPHTSPDTLDLFHALIRKAAHLSEYGLLGLLGARAWAASSVDILRRHVFFAAAAIVALAACADEYHQSFEASRTSSGWDVLLDVIGGVVGCTVFLTWRRYRERKVATSLHPKLFE